jgi:peptidoglycan hydrolase-like protein with peptidoglycan-binding domain
MKKYMALGLCVALLVVMVTGCAKKEEPIEQMQEPLSLDVAPMSTSAPVTGADSSAIMGTDVPAAVQEGIVLPPQGPYKPTNEEIQTALKNAGYYMGAIDGKVGPQTKKAITDFQAANSLKVDGKVGPQTWGFLSKYLNAAPAMTTNQTTRR